MDINDSKGYRKEEKYYFPLYMISYLEARLQIFARKDINALEGKYCVSSLYFDDIYNTAMNENEDGNDPRSKWRIRIYNHDMNHLVLENKMKKNGLTKKLSQMITGEEFERIKGFSGSGTVKDFFDEKGESLYSQFSYECFAFGLMPKVVVEYDRIPYVYDLNSVRITIDYNVACVDNVMDFGRTSLQRFPIFEKGNALLEVKYNGILPDFIVHIVQEFGMHRTTNSKYYMSRLNKMSRRGE